MKAGSMRSISWWWLLLRWPNDDRISIWSRPKCEQYLLTSTGAWGLLLCCLGLIFEGWLYHSAALPTVRRVSLDGDRWSANQWSQLHCLFGRKFQERNWGLGDFGISDPIRQRLGPAKSPICKIISRFSQNYKICPNFTNTFHLSPTLENFKLPDK